MAIGMIHRHSLKIKYQVYFLAYLFVKLQDDDLHLRSLLRLLADLCGDSVEISSALHRQDPASVLDLLH